MQAKTTLFLSLNLRERLLELEGLSHLSADEIAVFLTNKMAEMSPRFSVCETRFIETTDTFPIMKYAKSDFLGVIASNLEGRDIFSGCAPLSSSDCWWEKTGERKLLHQGVAYVCAVLPGDARNIIGAQHVFPALFALIEECLDSPCKTLTRHPLYLLSFIDGSLPPSSERNIDAFRKGGIGFIPILGSKLPLLEEERMDDYVKKWGKYNNFVLDETHHSVSLLIKTLETAVVSNKNGKACFKGSGDKFYSTNILGGVSLAKELGYTVDFAYAKGYVSKAEFSQISKFHNLRILLAFIEKMAS